MSASEVLAEKPLQTHKGWQWALSDSWVMTKRSVLHIVRSLDQVMSLVLFPIMFMLLNRYVLGGAINTGEVSYVNYLFAGIFVQTLAFGANYTTINLAVDMKEGIVDRFKSLPMASGSLLVGHITADLVRNVISGIVIILVGLAVGFRPTASLEDWMAVVGLAVLFTLSISWLSAILGLIVKSVEAAQWIGFVFIFPLTFISSAFVPVETMPAGLRAFAENQPVTQTIDAMRSLLVGTPMDNSALYSVLWSVGIIAVSMPLAIWMFKNRTTQNK